jgi:hypothetical protein
MSDNTTLIEPYLSMAEIARLMPGVSYAYLLDAVRRPPDKHPLPSLALTEDGVKRKARLSVVRQWLEEEERL